MDFALQKAIQDGLPMKKAGALVSLKFMKLWPMILPMLIPIDDMDAFLQDIGDGLDMDRAIYYGTEILMEKRKTTRPLLVKISPEDGKEIKATLLV